MILDQNLDFWRKFRFLTKISIFNQNFDFWPKFRFEENFNYWPTFRFLTKISIFDQNFDFWPKFRFFRVDLLNITLTRPMSLRLFRQLMRTCVLFFTDSVRTDNGPVWNSCRSRSSISSGVNSDFGLLITKDDGMFGRLQNYRLLLKNKRCKFLIFFTELNFNFLSLSKVKVLTSFVFWKRPNFCTKFDPLNDFFTRLGI